MTLTLLQRNGLQTKLTNGDVEGFYTDLITYGDPFAALGLGVTKNEGWQGQLANGFAASGAADNDIDLTFGSPDWTDLNENFAQRYLDAYEDNNWDQPDWEAIQTAHRDAYIGAGLDPRDWFPYDLLNNSSDPAGLWDDFMANQNASDLWDDAFVVADAGAGLAFPPYFTAQALADPDFVSQVDFARKFFDALGGLSDAARSDLASDITGIGDLVDLLNELPAGAGNLLDDIAWGFDNPGALFPELPAWLQPFLAPLFGVPGENPSPGQSLGGGDPLVIDLDNDGIELSSLANSGVHFDLWNDSFAESTAWVDADDGILVRDLDDDGLIEGVAEMFGSPHPLGYLTSTDFQQLATANGFAQLALLDSNSDGVISSADTAWGDIKVWRDLNQNGVSDSGELITLAAANIASIDVANWELDTFNGFLNGGFGRTIDGNTVTHSGFLTMTDTTTREIVDVWLQNDHADTFYTGDYTLDPRVLFLPTARGYGLLPNLHVAMSQNEELLDSVHQFTVARTSLSEFFDEYEVVRSEVRDILLQWAGVDIEATEAPSYEAHGLFEHMPEFYFLRKITGLESEYVGTWFDETGYLPLVADGVEAIFDSWNKAVDGYAARLMFQAGGSALFDGATYNSWTDEFGGDLDLVLSAVNNLETAATSATDKEMFWRGVALFIDNVKGLSNLTGTEIGWIDDAVDDSTSGALAWSDILDTLEPNIMSGTSGADTLTGTRWDDEINGGAGNDTLTGGDGNDVLIAGNNPNEIGNDTLSGGLGNDVLRGGRGNDIYHYDYGHDVIVEQGGNYTGDTDIIVFGSGITVSDVTLHMARLDQGLNKQLFLDIEGRGTLAIQSYYNTTNAINIMDQLHFADNSVLQFNASDIALYGTDGDDYYSLATAYFTGVTSIYGFEGNDLLSLSNNGSAILDGGNGDDELRGGAGNDSYVVSAGLDLIRDTGGTDTILIPEGYALGDISFFRGEHGGTYSTDDEIMITVNGLGSIIVLEQLFTNSSSKSIEYLKLANGTQIDLYSQVYTVRGTEGDDTFSPKSSFWSQQNDIYEFNGNIGNDTVFEGNGFDVLKIADGILPGDITIRRVAGSGSLWDDLRLSDGLGNSITFTGHFDDASASESLERVEFANGTIWNILSMEIQAHGTSGDDDIDDYDLGDASAADTIYGYGGSDDLRGGAGNDLIYGGDGDDNHLGGGDNNDTVYGENGSDVIYGDSGNDLLYGGDGNDTLNGDAGDDLIEGGVGNDTINGGGSSGGIDTITYANASGAVTVSLATASAQNTGGDGTDTISYVENLIGSAYNDTLTGTTGNNVIEGGAGNDTMNAQGGTDTLTYKSAAAGITINLATATAQNTGGAGTDTIVGFENLIGSAYNDTLTGDGNANVIEGGAGNDTINAQGGTDSLTYANASGGITVNLATATAQNTVGAGTDTISNFENLVGSAFNDTLTGTSSNNVIEGGAGNDTINAQGGTDTLTYANALGGVTVNLATATAQNTLGAGTDTVSNFENLTGSIYGDTLTGNTAANLIDGGDGNDTIQGGAGDDTLIGGNGIDLLSYTSAASAVTVNLATATAQVTGGAGTDTVSTFENLSGSAHNDTLTGTSGANTIIGNAGNDTINAGGGNDFLYGGAGLDTLTGSTGGDVFIFEIASAFANVDTITDFTTANSDKINIHDVIDIEFDPVTEAISQFVDFRNSGANSIMSIDRDGAGATYGFADVATLNGLNNLDETTLYTNGNLLAA